MQVVGMMVSVTVLELLDGHSEEARRIPEIDAGLHQPGRASVSQDVGRHIGTDPGRSHGRLEALTHALHRLAVPLNDSLGRYPAVTPPAHMGKQSLRDGDGRLSLFRLLATDRQAIEDPSFKVDVPATHRRHKCGTANCR